MLKVHIFLFLIPGLLTQSTTPSGGCCQRKTVSNSDSDLNGVYTWKRNGAEVEDAACFDGCVYTKEDAPESNEYCFKAVTSGAATIADECDATAEPTTDGQTPEPTSDGQTPEPTSDGQTTTASPGSTSNPEDRIEDANAKIAEANAKHTAATENANAANTASSTVDNIDSALNTATTTTASSGRVKRQSVSTTVSPIGNCDDFDARYNELLDALKV